MVKRTAAALVAFGPNESLSGPLHRRGKFMSVTGQEHGERAAHKAVWRDGIPYRHERAKIRRSLNSPVSVLITSCGKLIPNEVRTNQYPQYFQLNIRIPPPPEIPHCLKTGGIRSLTRLVVELAIEALEHREWPRTEAEIHLLRSAMFAAQAIIRDMERAGREEEIEQISRAISQVAPELPGKSADDIRGPADPGSGNM